MVVSKEGISIDPKRIEATKAIMPPKDKTGVRSFFGNIKCIRRFVPNFAEIVKLMNGLLKKDTSFVWDNQRIKSFEEIKERSLS